MLNFDLREGMILRNVKYDGRPIFYRFATSEMTVPYGDPRSPGHRKSVSRDFSHFCRRFSRSIAPISCECRR